MFCGVKSAGGSPPIIGKLAVETMGVWPQKGVIMPLPPCPKHKAPTQAFHGVQVSWWKMSHPCPRSMNVWKVPGTSMLSQKLLFNIVPIDIIPLILSLLMGFAIVRGKVEIPATGLSCYQTGTHGVDQYSQRCWAQQDYISHLCICIHARFLCSSSHFIFMVGCRWILHSNESS